VVCASDLPCAPPNSTPTVSQMPLGSQDALPTTASSSVQHLQHLLLKPEICARPSFARTHTENFVQRYIFPVSFVAAHVVVAHSMYRMHKRGERNVGKLTLFVLGLVELAMFWTFLPTSLSVFSPFYGAETFRRFFHTIRPVAGGLLNVLSGCDTFLTLLVCYEFRLLAQNAKTRALISTLRRQCLVYALIFIAALLTSVYAFALTYAPTFTACAGTRMDVRPVALMPVELIRALQWFFAATVIILPSIALIATNWRLARTEVYVALPTEANELIGTSKADQSLCKLRRLLAALTVCFVVPHVLSLAPMFIVAVRTLLSVSALSNALLFINRIACYSLLHSISHHLAKMGVVHVY
ncbi:hypothetical protein PFISCL1PPCAC_20634, partial [Pristionchus fissidentatus]